jgi:nitric oxide reductase NorE protein
MMDESANAGQDLPGNPLIWILIVSEVLVFAVALIAFLGLRVLHPSAFQYAAMQLHAGTGTAAMALLLTSGYLAALAQEAIRQKRLTSTRSLLVAAAALGFVFLVLKAGEYRDLWRQNVDFEDSTFFTLYALITGFHAAHVLFGAGLLLLVCLRPRVEEMEPSVAFWHMVDLVWVMVFPVIYLVPR